MRSWKPFFSWHKIFFIVSWATSRYSTNYSTSIKEVTQWKNTSNVYAQLLIGVSLPCWELKTSFYRKPNTSRDEDGKPRVLIFPLELFWGILLLKDSRAAECDIVKVTSCVVWFFCLWLYLPEFVQWRTPSKCACHAPDTLSLVLSGASKIPLGIVLLFL